MKYYSVSHIKELMDDADLVVEVIKTFIETVKKSEGIIEQGLKDSNYDSIAKAAHLVKSNCKLLKIDKSALYLEDIEKVAKSDIPDIGVIRNNFYLFKQDIYRSIKQMEYDLLT